jgi:hypothetical protein
MRSSVICSANIIRMIKSREDDMRETCSAHGEMRNAYKILVGEPEGKRPLRYLGVDGNMILKWILGK